MKAKVFLVVLALAVGLPVVAWTGTFLYWHLTIKREIASIEHEMSSPYLTGATFVQLAGGCRTLPYLIDVLETSRHPMMIRSAVEQITMEAGDAAEIKELFRSHPFTPQDAFEVRRANYLKVLGWWKANREKYHQWWRVWSSECSR